MNLHDRVAIVTGAARGIGAAIAQRLAGEGAFIAVVDLDEPAAATQAAQITASGGRAFALRADVSQAASVRAMAEAVLERTSRIDILVNNAGISGIAAPVAEYPDDEWQRVLATDLDSAFYCARAVVPHMRRQGWGRIVSIASIAGKEGNPTMAAYSVAKAGVIALTKALGKELATTGILVNCVAPAVIETSILEGLTEEAVQYMVSRIPMGRTGRPEEVAALVAWLCSDECSFSTGAVFDCSGGRATY